MMVRSPELDLDLLTRQLLSDPDTVTLNNRPRELADHAAYCRILGITGGTFDTIVSNMILTVGRTELYMSRPLTERILSTSGIDRPVIPVYGVADDGGTDKEAAP